jgi:hypothetical protein
MISRKLFIVLFITIFSSTTHSMQEIQEFDVTTMQLFLQGQQIITIYASTDGRHYTAALKNGGAVDAIQITDNTFNCKSMRADKNPINPDFLPDSVFFDLARLVTHIKNNQQKTPAAE